LYSFLARFWNKSVHFRELFGSILILLFICAGALVLCDVATGTKEEWVGHKGDIYAIDWKGEVLATAGYDHMYRLWDLASSLYVEFQ
jgi:hypothetical protein